MFKVLGETLTDDISIDKVELYLEGKGCGFQYIDLF